MIPDGLMLFPSFCLRLCVCRLNPIPNSFGMHHELVSFRTAKALIRCRTLHREGWWGINTESILFCRLPFTFRCLRVFSSTSFLCISLVVFWTEYFRCYRRAQAWNTNLQFYGSNFEMQFAAENSSSHLIHCILKENILPATHITWFSNTYRLLLLTMTIEHVVFHCVVTGQSTQKKCSKCSSNSTIGDGKIEINWPVVVYTARAIGGKSRPNWLCRWHTVRLTFCEYLAPCFGYCVASHFMYFVC